MEIIEENQNSLNNFFCITTELFLKAIKKGFPEINIDDMCYETELLNKYCIKGIEYIKNGIDPKVIEVLMESILYSIIKSENISELEILELTILKTIITLIQQQDIEGYLDYHNQIMSNPDRAHDEFKLLNGIK